MSETNQAQKLFGCFALIVCALVLAGLLLPALQLARGPARRNVCLNNLKKMALACTEFNQTKGHFPGYQAAFGRQADPQFSDNVKIGSWAVELMPYLEQQALRDRWDNPDNYQAWLLALDGKAGLASQYYPRVGSLVCPEDGSNLPEEAPLSYVANTAFYLLPEDPALGLAVYTNVNDASLRSTLSQRSANGIFTNHLPPQIWSPTDQKIVAVFGHAEPVTPTDLHDGASVTWTYAERPGGLSWKDYSILDDAARYRLGMVWVYAGELAAEGRPQPVPVTPAMQPGNLVSEPLSPTTAHPASGHPRIFNVANADGSIQSIDGGIDYRIYQALLTPNTAESDMPDPTTKGRIVPQ